MLLLVKSLLAHKAATAVAVAVVGTGATTAATTGVLPSPDFGSPEPVTVLADAGDGTGGEEPGGPAVTSTTVAEETPDATSSTTVAEPDPTTTTTVTEEPATTEPPATPESSTPSPEEASEGTEESEESEVRADNHGACVSGVAHQQRDTPPGRERGRAVSEAARTGCRASGTAGAKPEAGAVDTTVPVPTSTTPTTARPSQQREDRSGRPERASQSAPDTTVPAPQPAPTVVADVPATDDSAPVTPGTAGPASGRGNGGGRSDR